MSTPILSPSLAELITQAIESRLAELHTGLPAKVISFDASKQICNVQPLLLRVIILEDGSLEEQSLPQITNVPVHFPSAGGWSLIFPLKRDDIVFLTFAERSLDKWMEADPGQEVDPVETHKHDLSDAICIPGIRPRTDPIADLAGLGDACRLGFDGGDPAIVLRSDGTIEIGEGATESLLLGETLIAALAGHTHPFTGLAPGVAGVTSPTAQDFNSAKSEKAKIK